MSHDSVSEVAVVGVAHDIKGESIVAFVKLLAKVNPSDTLQTSLIQHLRDAIGPIATPEYIYWVMDLPKTRSGKIMRRILRHIVNYEWDKIGDQSTLVNPEVVEELITLFQQRNLSRQCKLKQ
jgi:acetyl-CoA synthetase